MEVIRSSWWVHNLHVGLPKNIFIIIINTIMRNELILIAKKEISLSSARRMLRSLTIISMRKKHDQTILDIPFGFSRADELINDYLSTVCEISELSLPKSQSIWMGLCVTKFVSEHSKLREMRIRCNEFSSSFLFKFLGNNLIDRIIISIFILIENMGMSMTESSSFNILAWDSHVITVLDKGSESQSFSSTPINTCTSFDTGFSGFKDLTNESMETHVFWQCGDGDTSL